MTILAIPDSADLGEVLDSCKHKSSDYFIDALAHAVFPDFFLPDCKFWGSAYGEDGNEIVGYHFARGFPARGVVAYYDVVLRDDEGNRVSLPPYSGVLDHLSKIKGLSIAALLKRGRDMRISQEGIAGFYPTGLFEGHPVLEDEMYFPALKHVITALLPGGADPVAELVKFDAGWENPPRTYVGLHLGVPDPTHERVERAVDGFVGLCGYIQDNVDALADAALVAHSALTARESRNKLALSCGDLPGEFAANVEGLFRTADTYVQALTVPDLDAWRI